ncbi:MAG: hypothetical protein AMXMBFR33_21540 [Candidatus Xenobia bacterium]|jgi:hypothetical protein
MSRRGLSALESVVTIAVLALVIVMLCTLYPMTGISIESSRQRLEAQSLAESTLDQLRGQSFAALGLGQRELPAVTRHGLEYRRQVEVFVVSGRDPDYLRGLEVRVSWSWRGRPQQLSRELWISTVGR